MEITLNCKAFLSVISNFIQMSLDFDILVQYHIHLKVISVKFVLDNRSITLYCCGTFYNLYKINDICIIKLFMKQQYEDNEYSVSDNILMPISTAKHSFI